MENLLKGKGKIAVLLFFFICFSIPVFASSIGGPEINIPKAALYSKDSMVKNELDKYEVIMNIKVGVEGDIVFGRDLTSADADVSNAELESQKLLIKISSPMYDGMIEPYIKIGTADFSVKWDKNSNNKNIEVDTDLGFMWSIGTKVKLWDFEDYGVKLTLDAHSSNVDLTVDSSKINGSTSSAYKDEKFSINEWQIALLGSKKLILPIGTKDFYIVPYTGVTLTSLKLDAHFTDSTYGLLYSTYDASDENIVGLVVGCDIMPSLLSWYLFNFELRFINETALSFGGTLKF